MNRYSRCAAIAVAAAVVLVSPIWSAAQSAEGRGVAPGNSGAAAPSQSEARHKALADYAARGAAFKGVIDARSAEQTSGRVKEPVQLRFEAYDPVSGLVAGRLRFLDRSDRAFYTDGLGGIRLMGYAPFWGTIEHGLLRFDFSDQRNKGIELRQILESSFELWVDGHDNSTLSGLLSEGPEISLALEPPEAWAPKPQGAEFFGKLNFYNQLLVDENASRLWNNDTLLYVFQSMTKQPYSMDWMLDRSPYVGGMGNEFDRRAARAKVPVVFQSKIDHHRKFDKTISVFKVGLSEYDFARKGFAVTLGDVQVMEATDGAWFAGVGHGPFHDIRVNYRGLSKYTFLPMADQEARELVRSFEGTNRDREVRVVVVAKKIGATRASGRSSRGNLLIGNMDLEVTRVMYIISGSPIRVLADIGGK